MKEKKQGKFRSDRQPQSDGEMDGLEMNSGSMATGTYENYTSSPNNTCII